VNAITPIQSTEKNEVNDSRIDLVGGFRSDDFLVVKEGFIAPKVCVYSGNSDENDLVPTTVYLGAEFKAFIQKLILTIVSFAILLSLMIKLDIELISIAGITGVVLWAGFYHFVYCVITPHINLYMDRKIRRNRRLSGLRNGLLMLTAYYFIFSDLKDDNAWWILPGIILLILSSRLSEKPLLESIGLDADGNECFRGAHADFLNTLPIHEEPEN